MMAIKTPKFPVHISGTHGVHIPEEYAVQFINAGQKRVQVKAFFKENTIDFHGAIQKYQGQYLISFGKRYQKELGIFPTDFFEFQLIENTTTYGVEIPNALKEVMESDPEGFSYFQKLTDGRKRGLIYYVKRFKNEQTQVDKSLIIFENLKRGITDPRELIKPI
ncbi:YdeI/OmpD-associated family protein [uncultured Dokdonia sp.]|uniref:YdeI/OmpD-associated family protein n=1 Tax=uncultured Dokdonia sp. TaxID=575653 RepID=UPI002626D5A3|nr:YdeI/OmpD-associated family protein [uncultured Dokdonia sp.]